MEHFNANFIEKFKSRSKIETYLDEPIYEYIDQDENAFQCKWANELLTEPIDNTYRENDQDLFNEIDQAKNSDRKIHRIVEEHSIHLIVNEDDWETNRTENLINKWNQFPEITLDLIRSEQMKDPILKQIFAWKQMNELPKAAHSRKTNKAFKTYLQLYEMIEIHEDNILLMKTPSIESPNEKKICLPISLIIAAFKQAHCNTFAGHMGKNKTLATLKRYFYFPGMYKWIEALIRDCINCQSNKNFRKDLQSAPLQEWGTTNHCPMQTVHIDYKGPLNPGSHGKKYCLVIIDAFSHYMQVIPTANVDADTTIKKLTENWIYNFGIPENIVHDQGTSFMNQKFCEWCTSLGIQLKPRVAYAPWSNGKVENQMQHLTRYIRSFLNDTGNNWAKTAPQFAFAANTSVVNFLGKTPYEILFGFKPQIPISLKLGVLRHESHNCKANKDSFCENLPTHSHTTNEEIHDGIKRFLRPQMSKEMLDMETSLNNTYRQVYEKALQDFQKHYENRNVHKLGKPFSVGMLVLLENHALALDRSQKLLARREGPYRITKVITPVTYEIVKNSNQTIKKIAHRNHLMRYIPKEESLSPLKNKYYIENRLDSIPKHILPTAHEDDDDFVDPDPDGTGHHPEGPSGTQTPAVRPKTKQTKFMQEKTPDSMTTFGQPPFTSTPFPTASPRMVRDTITPIDGPNNWQNQEPIPAIDSREMDESQSFRRRPEFWLGFPENSSNEENYMPMYAEAGPSHILTPEPVLDTTRKRSVPANKTPKRRAPTIPISPQKAKAAKDRLTKFSEKFSPQKRQSEGDSGLSHELLPLPSSILNPRMPHVPLTHTPSRWHTVTPNGENENTRSPKTSDATDKSDEIKRSSRYSLRNIGRKTYSSLWPEDYKQKKPKKGPHIQFAEANFENPEVIFPMSDIFEETEPETDIDAGNPFF